MDNIIETQIAIEESQYKETLALIEAEYKNKRSILSEEIKKVKSNIEKKKIEAKQKGISPKEKRRYYSFVGQGELYWATSKVEGLKSDYENKVRLLARQFPNVVIESSSPTKKDTDLVLAHSKTETEYYPGGFPSSSTKVPDETKLAKLAGTARNLNQSLVLIKAFCAVYGNLTKAAWRGYKLNGEHPLVIKAKSFGANAATLEDAKSFPYDPTIETTYKFKF